MIDQLLLNPERLWQLLATVALIGLFVYIIILSILQVRQIRILQDKVQTDADFTVRILTYTYIVVQVILFVIAILFL